MYVLIRIRTNDSRSSVFVSKTKKKLETHIKKLGVFWPKEIGRYIDDETIGISGGSGTEYIINQIDELQNCLKQHNINHNKNIKE